MLYQDQMIFKFTGGNCQPKNRIKPCRQQNNLHPQVQEMLLQILLFQSSNICYFVFPLPLPLSSLSLLLSLSLSYCLSLSDTSPPYLIMPGHRSIVNQTRYSSVHSSLISSGVEKSLKVISRIIIIKFIDTFNNS